MDRRIALLRGINVGTAKRIAMADLRRLFERLGHRDVRTLLNSGNVVFTPGARPPADAASRIERAIQDRLGVTTRVTLLGAGELRAALEANPFRQVADNPSRMLLLVLRDPTAAASLQPLLGKDWGPERIALGRSVAYLWTPDGVVKGKLWAAVDRAVGEGGTARNLATMTKLVALALGA